MAHFTLWSLAVVLGMCVPLASASYLTGSKFPFEGCVQNTMYSPYYATLVSYTENIPKQTSQFCLQLHSGPSCIKGSRDGKPTRCCDTHINKLKFFPAFGCRGSLGSATIANKTVTSVYWEEHDGFDIVKVTPLAQWLTGPEAADGQVICLNLKTPCWTMAMFSYDKEALEYSLYDKKVDNYECCPVGTLDVTYEPFRATTTSGSSSGGGGGKIAPTVKASPKPAPAPTPSPKKVKLGKSPKPARSPKPSRKPKTRQQ